jgi:gas vesicle protein
MDSSTQVIEPDSNSAQTVLTLFVGLLIGGLLGAGAMLLLAPQSGKRTRAKIQLKSIELRDQTTEAMEDMVEQATDKVQQTEASLRKQAKELEHRGQAMFDDQKKRLSLLAHSGNLTGHGS